MSVQSNTYVLVGVKLPYDHLAEERHEKLEQYTDSAYDGIEHYNGLCMVADGMSGEYTFIGRVLAKSIDVAGEPISATDCTTSDGLVAEVTSLLKEHFQIESPEVRTWAFTHYR